ncbi:baseplate J/gp47 family protein [Pseudomonas putida]|nr:baseplate J/gp47 family protein [Pseudomonas putida]
MSMLLPGQNQLADPEIVLVEDFETLLAEFKAFLVEYVRTRSPSDSARLADSLENESELLTMVLEAFTLRLQAQERKWNSKIKQMLAWWATGKNLDARLADMGLERQVISPGDPSAFPPVDPVYEDDESARIRYYLAPHAPAGGSRLHYQREVRTLGERANVSLATPSPGVVVVTYKFSPDGNAVKVKDGNGRRTAPGEVAVTVLARAGNGAPDAALLAAVRKHFARDDVVPETDSVTVQGATIKEYKIRAIAYINAGPDTSIVKLTAVKSLQAYADDCHILGGRVETSWIDAKLHGAGAVRIEVLEPLAPVVTTDSQAPYCTGIDVQVRTL